MFQSERMADLVQQGRISEQAVVLIGRVHQNVAVAVSLDVGGEMDRIGGLCRIVPVAPGEEAFASFTARACEVVGGEIDVAFARRNLFEHDAGDARPARQRLLGLRCCAVVNGVNVLSTDEPRLCGSEVGSDVRKE